MSQLNQECVQQDVRNEDRAELELRCVNLICQLENLLATAKESDRGDQVEDSAKAANKMLDQLITFVESSLTGQAAEEALEEIRKASDASAVHKEILGNRSWGSTFLSIFVSDAVDENSKITHEKLGKQMARTCATTLHHAIELVGAESVIGQQISQSTAVFVHEFVEVW